MSEKSVAELPLKQNYLGTVENKVYNNTAVMVGLTPEGNTCAGFAMVEYDPTKSITLYHLNSAVIAADIVKDNDIIDQPSNQLSYPALLRFNDSLISGNGLQTEIVRTMAEVFYKDIERSNNLEKLKLVPSKNYKHQDHNEVFLERVIYNAFGSERSFDLRIDKDKRDLVDITDYYKDAQKTPRISALAIADMAFLWKASFHEEDERKNYRIEIFKFKDSKGRFLKTWGRDPENPFEEINIKSDDPSKIAKSLEEAVRNGMKKKKNSMSFAAAMVINKEGGILSSQIINNWNSNDIYNGRSVLDFD